MRCSKLLRHHDVYRAPRTPTNGDPPPDGDRRPIRRELRWAVHRRRKSRQPHDDWPRSRVRPRPTSIWPYAAAAAAFEAWRLVAPRDRGRLLSRIADAVEAELETLARTVAQETGNAIRTQARPEVKSAIDVLRYFGGVASELKGETVPLGEHVLSYTRREPIGMVGGIVPWNAPVVLGTLKIAMSVAAGNTLVLKAAEDAPLGLAARRATLQRTSAAGRGQPADRLRRGVRRSARPPPARAQTVVHRVDRSRKAHHARGGGSHRARLARAWRQEPRDRLSGRR